MPWYTDQLGRRIKITNRPESIVSLVPSQTELLFSLGLDKEVTGITKFCVHPQQWFRNKTRIGGTKQIHTERIKSLQPHLIIANKEENLQDEVEELAAQFPVWVSDVHDLFTACNMMTSIGEITGKQAKARQLEKKIQAAFHSFKKYIFKQKPRTAYLIWREPYMTTGGDTFVHQMMQYAGFENIFAEQIRYPVTTIYELQTSQCELLLLSSEPYPFAEKHIKELQVHLPQTKIILVDGELFSWYGSRLLKAPAYFQHLRKNILAMFHP